MNIDLSEALKALDNPTRLAILTLLKNPSKNFPEQEADPDQLGVCVSIIQERVGLSQSTVSNYLAALNQTLGQYRSSLFASHAARKKKLEG